MATLTPLQQAQTFAYIDALQTLSAAGQEASPSPVFSAQTPMFGAQTPYKPPSNVQSGPFKPPQQQQMRGYGGFNGGFNRAQGTYTFFLTLDLQSLYIFFYLRQFFN